MVRGPEAEDRLESRCSLINGSSDQNLNPLDTDIDVVSLRKGREIEETKRFTKDNPATQ